MSRMYKILLLEDEPVILMDLEFAAEDRGLQPFALTCPDAALQTLEQEGSDIDLAVLDVSLGGNKTCFPVARELERRSIPYILHSANLDRLNERFRQLEAQLVPKPAPSEHVIDVALQHLDSMVDGQERKAAE